MSFAASSMCIGLHMGAYNANFGGMCWKIQRKRIAVIAKDGKLLIMKLVEAESQSYSYLSVSHRGEWPELTQDMSLYGHILTEERWWPDRTPAEITGNAHRDRKKDYMSSVACVASRLVFYPQYQA